MRGPKSAEGTGMNRKAALLALSAALLQGVVLYAFAAGAQPAAAPAGHPKFDSDIAPVFNKYCVGCHSGAQPKGDMLLKFKDEDDARSRAANDDFWSKAADEMGSGRMPPASVKNRPTDGERKLLVDWINNDVLTIAGKPDPGPLVFHRLNNREYANTIRELLYLPDSYNAAADFPADERGDGFDNNSDTLTISPELIEHYLSAAAKASKAAFKPAPTDGDGKAEGPLTSNLNLPAKDIAADYFNPLPKVRKNVEAYLLCFWCRFV